MHMEVTLLDASAPIVISSQLLNRQDGEDEYHVRERRARRGPGPPPGPQVRSSGAPPPAQPARRRARGRWRAGHARLPVREQWHDDRRCVPARGRDRMCRVRRRVAWSTDDLAKTVFTFDAHSDQPIQLTKFVVLPHVAGHPGRGVGGPVQHGRIDRATHEGREPGSTTNSTAWLDEFWTRQRRRDHRRRRRRSRRFGGTCSSSRRRRPGPTNRASPPRP